MEKDSHTSVSWQSLTSSHQLDQTHREICKKCLFGVGQIRCKKWSTCPCIETVWVDSLPKQVQWKKQAVKSNSSCIKEKSGWVHNLVYVSSYYPWDCSQCSKLCIKWKRIKPQHVKKKCKKLNAALRGKIFKQRGNYLIFSSPIVFLL